MINPFFSSLGGSRRQFTQPQNQFNQQQNQYDFSGWGDRLNKIEEGIASLTNQFNNFQTPGDVAPEYTGNAAPEPLEQSANAPDPLGGIESLVAPQDTGFNFDPSGGSLFDQLSTSYGQPSTMQDQFNQDNPNYVSQAVAMGYAEPGTPHYIRGGGDYTQGFQDFVHDQGYYVDPRGSWVDGGMDISETPIDLPDRMRGTMQQPNQPFQTLASPSGGKMAGSDNLGFPGAKPVERPINDIHDTGLLPGAPSGAQLGLPQNTGYVPEPYTGGDRGLAMQAGMNLPGAGGRPSDLQQPIQQGVGLAGLYQQNKGPGI